ncbi:MFS transporter [Sphingomonas koreensis]|uniref:AmpG family muropeptide MFS transporter n=1 Tax=Sphingomonas koreensis TaxID=93064 RepID=UPI00082FA734|nr:MFS transporter [Sphingomonas koreensis]PJI87018.1 PAT family beta-lactamase induction signal transducer AmpG [Sphingomonas koreensis]RSU69480.1 MFS transporter [Sphingomonas koreensis]
MSEAVKADGQGTLLDGIRPYFEKAPLAALALGMSSGFPFAMIGATLTTRLAQDGITKSAVTAFALTFLAYNLKWAWAPVVDKFRIPVLGAIGARRSWLIVTGALVAAAVIFLGSVDPKASLGWVAAAAIMVGLAGATFDIVIDAYRIELLEPRQLGVGSGMSQYGWRIGSAAAGGLALYVAEGAGWGVAYAACAIFALPAVLAGLIVGEPERKVFREWPERMGQKPYLIFVLAFAPLYLGARWIDGALGVNILSNMVLVGYLFPLFDLTARRARDAGKPSALTWLGLLPVAGVGVALWQGWSASSALVPLVLGAGALLWIASLVSIAMTQVESGKVGPLMEFFRREGGMMVLLFVLLHKLGDTLANLTLRLLFNEQGYTNSEIAFYDVFVGFWALLAGIFVGGIMYAKLGMKRSVFISLVLMMVSNLSFAGMASVGHTNAGMAAAMGFENFASGIGGVCVGAYLAALCNLSFTATQFALLSAAASILGRFLSGTSAGKMIEGIGYVNYYVLTTILALPGVLLFAWMMRSGLVDRSIGTAGTEGEGDARADPEIGSAR